jgi:hypothetical protein
MGKIVDYKFLIMLGLSVVIYFLYREIEQLNKRVSELENNNNSIDITPKINKKMEPPPVLAPSPIPIVSQVLSPLPTSPLPTSVLVDNHIEEEYSNEEINHSNSNNIYSCDKMDSNTNEHDQLMVDSLINMVNEQPIEENNNKTTETIENLLKKKLDELQNMANELNININNDNGKKKRKVDLANEILNKINYN